MGPGLTVLKDFCGPFLIKFHTYDRISPCPSSGERQSGRCLELELLLIVSVAELSILGSSALIFLTAQQSKNSSGTEIVYG